MTLLDIDPNLVRPGWIPLLITIVMALVLVLLFRIMRRQMGRIQVPKRPEQRDAEAGTPPGPQD